MTMVAGRVVFDGGEHPGIDIAEVRAAAMQAAVAARLPSDPANVDRTRRLRAELRSHYRRHAAKAGGSR
jgi:hypothetical protein